MSPKKLSTSASKIKKSPSKNKKTEKPLRTLQPEVLPAEDLEQTEVNDSQNDDEPLDPDFISDTSQGLIEISEPTADSDDDTEPKDDEKSIDTVSRAISPTDPLKRYLDEVKHYPLLSPEDELKLAIRLQQKGDREAAMKLVQANLRLVVKIAFEYRSVYANVMDLIQEGNVGLMKAVSKFDPTKGARLGYYSSWWIRSYILKYLLDNFRLVRVGTTQAQKKLFFHLMREKEKLEAQGIAAAPKLLADKLNVKEKDVIEMDARLSHHGGEVSLDAPVGSSDGDSKASFVDLLEDSHESPDSSLEREELLQVLKNHLPQFTQTLNDREKQLLKERLLSEEPKTLQEVADRYGLTRERARQIETVVIQKLRDFLKPHLK